MNRKLWYIVGGICIVVFVFVYRQYDPRLYSMFPKCPFLRLTGYRCPGCGSQRAIHDLLNLDISSAWHANQLLVVSIPYLAVGYSFLLFGRPTQKMIFLRKLLYGPMAIKLVFVLVMAFWILRNILGF